MKKLDDATLRAHKGISFVGISASFICHDGEGSFYMALRGQNARDEQGTWDLGGGGVKWGEKVEDVIRREIKEEYGAEVLELEFLGYDDIFRKLADGTPTHWLAIRFAARVNRDDVFINEPEVLDDGGWFTLNNLPSPLHSQALPFLKKYQKQLKQILGS